MDLRLPCSSYPSLVYRRTDPTAQVYELLLGVPLFSRNCESTTEPDHYHLTQMRAVTGDELPPELELPPHVLANSPATHLSHLFREKAYALGLPERDVVGAIDLMSRCLRIDPAARPTAIQLARESPWLLELGDDF
jgi:hypothetical protein